ncbi:hypothetical protein Poli38472_005224 [Pythium oligandrum]|uniref:Uncharacterized protein n=1 Tax=Pythium oligandrum TaxID=41045 RepID=A0A8K1CGY3_PYTOL|nr:hypothetical protein Poli38472_005224 [Pythium oligandrum]|eukprot:TMW62606.1 hypothetical protein Poli38472_005224 [Pythium oligandrum]
MTDVPSYAALLDDLVSMQYAEREECLEETALDLVLDGDTEAFRQWLKVTPALAINARSAKTGRSFLHWASAEGHKEIVKILLDETEANMMLRTMLGGCTALHLAVTNNHRSIVFQLLSHGADVLARDKFGCAPMHYVRSVNVAKLLTQYGGRVLDYNAKRRNALQSVLLQAELDRETDCIEIDPAVTKELQKYLQTQADLEYKAKLTQIRELKQRTKAQQKAEDKRRKKTLKDC